MDIVDSNVRLVITLAASVDLPTYSQQVRNKLAFSMHFASGDGHYQLIEMLVKHSVDLNAGAHG
jgi:hypothetical protein